MEHETFIHAVAELALARLPDAERAKCEARLVYGAGRPGVRGTTFFGAWQNGAPEPVPFVEVCAFGESSPVQLIGTTIHELGHVYAGPGAGHGKAWREACARLGLRRIRAAGTHYCLAMLAPDLRDAIARLPAPSDGRPVGGHRFNGAGNSPGPGAVVAPRPCRFGHGSRGGKSRGAGSGSRMRKFVCRCDPPVIVRSARDQLHAHCDHCKAAFTRGD